MLLLMLLCYYWCGCSFIAVDFWTDILGLDGPDAVFEVAAVVAPAVVALDVMLL